MSFDLSCPVFKRICTAICCSGKLTLLADENERNSETFCKRSSKKEAARLNTGNSIDSRITVYFNHAVNTVFERFRFHENTSNVIEKNARLRKVGNAADSPVEHFKVCHIRLILVNGI